VEKIIASERNSEPTLPLRIGINSDIIFVGDLGGTLQIKPTVIGHGVNFAKRLESACDFFCIMVGQRTKKRICELNPAIESLFLRRPIHVKHRHELIEAFEIDPLKETSNLKNAAIRVYRNYVGIWRQSDRFSIPENIH